MEYISYEKAGKILPKFLVNGEWVCYSPTHKKGKLLMFFERGESNG